MAGGFDMRVDLDDAALQAGLSRAALSGANMRQPMGEIAEAWMGHVRERFAQERDPLGVPWAKRRDNVDPERKLLHLHGDLQRAVIPEFGSDFAQVGVLKTAGPARYARIHNEGGTILPKRGKALAFGGRIVSKVVMPRRQYVGFGPDERQSVVDILSRWASALFGGGQ